LRRVHNNDNTLGSDPTIRLDEFIKFLKAIYYVLPWAFFIFFFDDGNSFAGCVCVSGNKGRKRFRQQNKTVIYTIYWVPYQFICITSVLFFVYTGLVFTSKKSQNLFIYATIIGLLAKLVAVIFPVVDDLAGLFNGLPVNYFFRNTEGEQLGDVYKPLPLFFFKLARLVALVAAPAHSYTALTANIITR